MRAPVAVLGIFVADLAFRAPRLPLMGETILGQGFKDGPGGKGSNQAIAAARAGGDARMITRIGRDTFGDMAQKAWAADGIDISAVAIDEELPTGAAFIFVSTETGNNAIIVESGAAAKLSPADVAAAEQAIAGSKVLVTQFEQPVEQRFELPPALRAFAGRQDDRLARAQASLQRGEVRQEVPVGHDDAASTLVEGGERFVGAAEEPRFDADVIAAVAKRDGNDCHGCRAFRNASTVVSCGAAMLGTRIGASA